MDKRYAQQKKIYCVCSVTVCTMRMELNNLYFARTLPSFKRAQTSNVPLYPVSNVPMAEGLLAGIIDYDANK